MKYKLENMKSKGYYTMRGVRGKYIYRVLYIQYIYIQYIYIYIYYIYIYIYQYTI